MRWVERQRGNNNSQNLRIQEDGEKERKKNEVKWQIWKYLHFLSRWKMKRRNYHFYLSIQLCTQKRQKQKKTVFDDMIVRVDSQQLPRSFIPPRFWHSTSSSQSGLIFHYDHNREHIAINISYRCRLLGTAQVVIKKQHPTTRQSNIPSKKPKPTPK